MKLIALHLQNFRGYKNIKLDLDENLNVIVGRNDVGKSTILEALAIFFDCNSIKLDKDDWNIECEDVNGDIRGTMSISCIFKIINDKIILDESNITTCKDEFLINKNGFLEVKKEWKNGGHQKPKIYLVANYPKDFINDPLLTKTQTNLKAQYENIETEAVYHPTDLRMNAELRKSIYSSIYDLSDYASIDKEEINLEVASNFKDLGDKIIKQLPFFYLFKSDRNNTDKDDEIQNPLKVITDQILDEMSDVINDLQEKVKIEVEKVGNRTVEMLKQIGGDSISNDIKPCVTIKPLKNSFIFDLISENNIPLNKRGSGIRRLVLLSYFRAEAEKEYQADDNNKNIIYAIEEPETSQHPNFQSMIIESLIDLSKKGTHQIIITTHTPEFAKMVSPKELIFIGKDNGMPIFIENQETKISKIKSSLGILPNIDYKLVVHVEGPNDVNFLYNINQNIDELKSIINLKEKNIPIIPLRGSSLLEYIEKDYYEDSNVKEIHIYDNDRDDFIEKVKEMNTLNDGRRFGLTTNLLEMENYIHKSLVETYFDIELDIDLEDWKYNSIPDKIAAKFQDNPKYGQDIKAKNNSIKQILNNSISKNIRKEHLEEMDIFEEVESWFKLIRDNT